MRLLLLGNSKVRMQVVSKSSTKVNAGVFLFLGGLVTVTSVSPLVGTMVGVSRTMNSAVRTSRSSG